MMISILDRFRKTKANKLDNALLVLMSDGFGLLASVVDKKEGEVTIVASARSALSDPVAALVEVFGRLSVSYGKLPKESILLHAHAIPSMLELPIENIHAIEDSKLQELIRWEMEAVFADLVPHDNLGWLMIGLGYISESQRDALVKKLAEENTGNQRKVRIGDLAIAEGYINRNQLESCLTVQDQLQLQDQRIKCGWSRIDRNEQTRWLATAISEAVHHKWVTALQSVSAKGAIGKTKLKSIYSFIGAGSSQLKQTYQSDTAYVLELHRPYMALNSYQNSKLVDCLVLECSGNTPQISDIETLLSSAEVPAGTEIYVTVTHADRAELRESLSNQSNYYYRHLEREVPLPNNLAGDVSSAEAVMIFGAAFNYFSSTHQMLAAVPGVKPPPPFLQRNETKAAASVLLFLFIIGGIETGYAWHIDRLENKLSAVEEKVKLQQKVKKDIAKSKQAQTKIDTLNQQYEGIIQLKKLMETVLVTRNQFMDEFLDMVVLNINDNLLVDSIVEQEWNVFIIRGWSLDQASIEYFGQGLSRDLRNWGMEITDSPSELGRSNGGFSGYKFRFVIRKVPTAVAQQ